jgi:hypothetical protein
MPSLQGKGFRHEFDQLDVSLSWISERARKPG